MPGHRIRRRQPGLMNSYTGTLTRGAAAAAAGAGGMGAWNQYMNNINEGIAFANRANRTYFNAKEFVRNATRAAGRSKARTAGGRKPTRQSPGSQTGALTRYGMNYSKNMKTKGKKGWKGKLTIPYNKKKAKQYRRKMPFSIMQRYFLCPAGNLDTQNNVLSFAQDMFTSNPSVNAKHMSSVVLSLSVCENHLNPENYSIGKNLVPYDMNSYVGANTVLWEQNSTNTALETVQIPMQVNRFPVSAYSSRWMQPSTGEGHKFEMPSSVITGINLNLVFKAGGQPFPQILSVKIVRCNLPVAFRSGEWDSADGVVPAAVIQRELCNRGNFTSRLAFDTVWTKSIKLGACKANTKIPTVRLKKFIKCQYLRSTIRRVSTAGDQATLGSQALPSTYQSQDGYFNNLYVVISSKCVDDQYVATITRDVADAGLGDNQNTREELGTLSAIPPAQINAAGAAVNKLSCFFRYGGTMSVYRRVKESDSGINGGLNQTLANVQTLQDQIHELQQIVGAHQDDDSDCTSCHSDTDHESDASEEDCGSGHAAGASPPGDGHTHPNDLTAEEHDANCQHSH